VQPFSLQVEVQRQVLQGQLVRLALLLPLVSRLVLPLLLALPVLLRGQVSELPFLLEGQIPDVLRFSQDLYSVLQGELFPFVSRAPLLVLPVPALLPELPLSEQQAEPLRQVVMLYLAVLQDRP
jgi:hypothetical protein